MMPCGYSTPQSFCHLNKSPFRVLIQRQAHQCIFETLWIRTPCSLYIQLPFGAQQQAYIHSHKHKGNDQQGWFSGHASFHASTSSLIAKSSTRLCFEKHVQTKRSPMDSFKTPTQTCTDAGCAQCGSVSQLVCTLSATAAFGGRIRHGDGAVVRLMEDCYAYYSLSILCVVFGI